MSSLEIYIGKSKYTIDCEESQRARIISLASRLNEKVNNMSLNMRGVDEKTILMLAAITIEEELDNLKTSNISQANNTAQHNPSAGSSGPQITQSYNEISSVIENLANKIKKY